MFRDVEAVVFDLDGTLLDRRQSFERFVQAQWQRFAHRLHGVDQAYFVQRAIACDDRGYAPRRELFVSVLAPFDLPAAVAEDLLSDYRAGFSAACSLFHDAAFTLASLRSAGFKLGVITNGSVRMQSAKVHSLALAPAFEVIVISDAEGISKPDPRIFHLAMERLGIGPGGAVFVGDHPDVDVAGARAAGMKAIWRRDPSVAYPVHADAVIDELSELLALLKRAG